VTSPAERLGIDPSLSFEGRPAHISTQTPAPQRCPVAHWLSEVQMQKPARHCPLGPHWPFAEQVPQVPPTHASPPPHWLLAVQAVHFPSTHARPIGLSAEPRICWLQSANVAHGAHVPPTQALPSLHPFTAHWLGPAESQIPETQTSSGAQSPAVVQVHCMPSWVAAHWAVGPHWLLVEQAPHFPPAQTCPLPHWLFVVHVLQPPVHCRQVW
jgi:hypothetical protein